MQRKFVILCLCLCALLALPFVSLAQNATPSVSVSDQVILNGKAVIDSVYSAGQGWIVIHSDNNGQPGRVAGFAPVNPGWTYNLEVPFDATIATPTLYAMLHVDDGTIGKYEFDGQSGLDNPVLVNGAVVTPSFKVNIIDAHDQFIQNNQFVADAVTVQQDGWLVIHSDNNGAPGPVLGEERILAGTSTNVAVDLQTDGRTEVLWPMLHVDTGTAGVYEFGTVPGADPPVSVRGVVATEPFWTVPHARVENQVIVHGDGGAAPGSTIKIDSVLSQGPGWLVIHVDSNNAPGPVAGYVAVKDGYNANLTIDNLDTNILTPVLWPMLHVDTGTIGEYEFGTVPGADSPVTVDGKVVQFPINAAPSLVLHDQEPLPSETTGKIRIVVDQALSDGPGWLAIHANNNGVPGPVIGTALLHDGQNNTIFVDIDQAQASDEVFPMLHLDTGALGQYEFGTVQGADAPVSVSGKVVVAPMKLSGANVVAATQAATQAPTQAAAVCTITARGTVNRRSGPGTSFPSMGQISGGQSALVVGQTQNNGYTWLQLSDGSFVRSDVVNESGDCATVAAVSNATVTGPTVASPTTAAPTIQPPNATPEVGG